MRCNMCFKDKPNLQPPLPKFPVGVCKGCFYEIDRVVGFLLHYGFPVVAQGTLPETPPTPPKTPKSPKSNSKGSFGHPSSPTT
ncbi:hypothetical protein ES703_118508 [subsurface metagenome]